MQTYVDWIAPTFVLSLTGLPVARSLRPRRGRNAGRSPGRRPPIGEEAVLALAHDIQRLRPLPPPPFEQYSE